VPGVPGTTPVRKGGAFGLCHVAILLLDRASLGRLVAHLTSLGVPAGMSASTGLNGRTDSSEGCRAGK